MNVEAITASIAHEIRQPLAAIELNGDAALELLGNATPDHDEVWAVLNDIISDVHRTDEVFEGIRALFRKADKGRQRIDMNEIIIKVLQSVRSELKDHGVATRTELMPQLPLVDGNRNQLQQVIFNLVHNAIEAMNTTTGRRRMLRVRTELRNGDAIAVSVEDSGPGIDSKKLDGIFDAFFTTKAHGMGLGLAICRMIIVSHGGELTVSSDGKSGALFQYVLPTETTEKATAQH